MSEKYGIRGLKIGDLIKDDDYGSGVIIEIVPLPRQSWTPPDHIPGNLTVDFSDGIRRIVPSSCVETLEQT